jgi:hypothetical protein
LFCPLFQKWRSTRSGARRVGEYGISFVSFSLCLFWQRKAAKRSDETKKPLEFPMALIFL